MTKNGPTITSRGVPQADNLDRVREAVGAVAKRAATPADVAALTGVSARQANYCLVAAETLGLLRRKADESYVIDAAGRHLLKTSPQSAEESDAFANAIHNSPVIEAIAPTLMNEPGPAAAEIARTIQDHTGLGTSTAERRAQTLIAWRERIRERQRQLSLTGTTVTRTISVGMDVLVSSERPQLQTLHLENFKNFVDETLHLGPLTVLVGANASGKSNVRDAFRFIHGIARGYTLAEIIGEKWIEGGVLVWKGIRGGTRETAFRGAPKFTLGVSLRVQDGSHWRNAKYRISVEVSQNGHGPRVVAERLVLENRGTYVFDSSPKNDAPIQDLNSHLKVRLRKEHQRGFKGPTVSLFDNRPALVQLADHPEASASVREHVGLVVSALQSVRFLDLSPDAMRNPSIPGQTILGDRGENLSSVLQAICENPARKQALLEWVRELTPLDVRDFDFPADPTGRVLVSLVEDHGHKTSVYSASDGTLRFLAMIAALLGPEPANVYFFEELENGIHPTRLHLLLQLIEQQTSRKACQVIATTHSPFLLTYLGKESLKFASLIHRGEGKPNARVIRILDIRHISKVLEHQDLARLHGTGWLENAVKLNEQGGAE